jgi:endonuclease YncB( thermonuclease family)
MPFLLIQGVFHPHSGHPDGDSVRFQASQPQLFQQLPQQITIKGNGEVQLRYEGLDALEKKAIQSFAQAASQANQQLLGGDQDNLPGYILCSYGDAHGRPVSFVFAGAPPAIDGTWLELTAAILQSSVNYQLLRQGLVYPLFYDTLLPALRQELTAAIQLARQQQLGVWPADRTNQGFETQRSEPLDQLPPILPKLWRCLEQFYKQRDREHFALLDFKEWLAEDADHLVMLPDHHRIHFAKTIAVQAHSLKMLYLPEELLFGTKVGL